MNTCYPVLPYLRNSRNGYKPMSLTKLAHDLIRQHFADPASQLRTAVDATCGNGFDTLFLASLGFREVNGFDIQTEAIDATRARLDNAGYTKVQLFQQGHESLSSLVQQPLDCVMFNFGYLPGADKSITTLANTSLTAVQQAADMLSGSGILSLMCYPGHAAGADETRLLKPWVASLGASADWKTSTHLSATPSSNSPILFVLERVSADR